MKRHNNASEVKPQAIFSRAGRAGPEDMLLRVPELQPLRLKTICVFGLGCIGAPSVLEFARAGVGKLKLLDGDFVDPSTVCRWPLGLSVAGLNKADVLAAVIKRDYPYTEVESYVHRLGNVTYAPMSPTERTDTEILEEMLAGASLIYDATAEIGVHQLLSSLARERKVPYVSVAGTYGGWGGIVCRIRPANTKGCWYCYQKSCVEGSIPQPSSKELDDVQPPGCGDPTFTGASFDLVTIAMAGVRLAISTLCSETKGGYPTIDADVVAISMRDAHGVPVPSEFKHYSIPRNAACVMCKP